MPFAAWCKEKTGMVLRKVWLLSKSRELLTYIYEKIKDIPNFITADYKNMSASSITWLEDPSTYIYAVDDVGLVVVCVVEPLGAAHVHITFWDKRLRGREELCRELARRVIAEHALDFLYTVIPTSSSVVLAFAQRVGFQFMSDKDGIAFLAVRRIDLPSNYTV